MIARTLLALLVLASTCAAAAEQRHHHHHHYQAVAQHHAIPADAFAQAPEIIPLPRPRPFAAIWNDRVTEVVGGR